MLEFCLLWACLVLGGVAGSLIFREVSRGIWHQLKRVPVRVRRPVLQRAWGPTESLALKNIHFCHVAGWSCCTAHAVRKLGAAPGSAIRVHFHRRRR